MSKIKTCFYGSIYDEEAKDYKDIIENQFKNCAIKAEEDKLDIVTWGFDVLIKDKELKEKAQSFVNMCAEIYFPNIKNVTLLSTKNDTTKIAN